jgi:hypothetical protein
VLELSAGDLSAVLDGPDIRQITVRGQIALSLVYVTVRDGGWRTAPAEVIATHRSADGRHVTVDVRHRLDEISFRWHGEIELAPGRIIFTVDGEAETAFAANRIGLCMLHPQSLRGSALRVGGPGGEASGSFSAAIAPHQPFVDFDHMTYPVTATDELQIKLTGDLFEMEDHRNWSDPGWKTYCTPLSRPMPASYLPGQRIRQSVELTATPISAAPRTSAPGSADAPSSRPPLTITGQSSPVRLEVAAESSRRFPMLGLGASDLANVREPHGAPGPLPALCRPQHVHVELEHGQEWRPRLLRATAEAEVLGVTLDVALIAPSNDLASMATDVAAQGERIHRVSVFAPDQHTTEPGTVAMIRTLLAGLNPSAEFGGGSRANFAELNRGSFIYEDWDFVTYALNPQVHHTDDRSILSTVSAISDGLAQAGRIAGGVPVVVGPVTLRPRFNAYTGAPDPLPDPRGPGPDIDPRQAEDLAGVYLAGAVTELVGASAITAYRTVGPRGIFSANGAPTPAARVFTAFAELAGSTEVPVTTGTPDVVGVAAHWTGDTVLIITNLSEIAQTVDLVDLRIVDLQTLVGQTDTDDINPAVTQSHVLILPRTVLRLVVKRGNVDG